MFFHRTSWQFQHCMIPLCQALSKVRSNRKKKRRALAEFSSVLSAFWEAFHGGFPIKYLPAFTLMTVKGTWKGNAELCLEVFSIVLCHPTTFYIHLLGICCAEVQAAFSRSTGNILFCLQCISEFCQQFSAIAFSFFFFLLFSWFAMQCTKKLIPAPLAWNSTLNSLQFWIKCYINMCTYGLILAHESEWKVVLFLLRVKPNPWSAIQP